MSSKEKFEAWRISIGDDPISMTKMADGTTYLYGWTRMHWNTWQACEASREAVFLEGYRIPFDYKTASDLVCSDIPDNVRKFVSDAKLTSEECNGNRNTIADLRKEIQRRDAETEMLKSALLDAEASRAVPIELPSSTEVTIGQGCIYPSEMYYKDELIATLEAQGYRVKE